MSSTPEQQEQRLTATRESAAALMEDIPHIRHVISQPDPPGAEIRRLTATLRRLLVDGDLTRVAAPRVGRVELLAPDNNPVIKSNAKQSIPYFGSAGVEVFGVWTRAVLLESAQRPRTFDEFNPERTVLLRVDSFLNQPVLCLMGQWATRRDAIKYIANVASGVHSGAPADDKERLLNRIRHAVTHSVAPVPKEAGAPDGTMAAALAFNPNVFRDESPPFSYRRDAVDPVLVEVLAAGHYLVTSRSVIDLETAIAEELGGPPQ